MKFRKRPEIVEAHVYEPGMEDAFGYRCNGIHGFGMLYDGMGRPAKPDPKIHGPLVPVILCRPDEHDLCAIEIGAGDWIVTDVLGKRSIVKADDFAKLYESP